MRSVVADIYPIYWCFAVVLTVECAYADIEVSKGRLFSHVEKLISTPASRSFSNVSSLDTAAQYIKSELQKIGYSPQEQVYTVNGNAYRNICALIGPAHTQRIVVGAHYDVCGEQKGADDNASGVAGLLELARVVFNNSSCLKNQIEFVAYTLEEPPNFGSTDMGSYIHARSMKERNVDVKVMICLEMIGFFSDEKIQRYPIPPAKLFYPNHANFIAVVGNFNSRRFITDMRNTIRRRSGIPCSSMAITLPGIDLSDHRNYWLFGFKAFMITDTSFYRNRAYHTMYDTINTLDFDKMAEVVKGVACYLIR